MLLVTDGGHHFASRPYVDVHPFQCERFHYNLKCRAYRAGIQKTETILWVDADTVLAEAITPEKLTLALSHDFPPGLHTHELFPREAYPYPVMEQIAVDWKLPYDPDNITYQERLVVLRRTGQENAFVDLWQKFGDELLKRKFFGVGDGTAMAICAQACGIPCHGARYFSQTPLNRYFIPMRHRFPLGLNLRPVRKLRSRLKGQWPGRPREFSWI